jgi:hypothetical protein
MTRKRQTHAERSAKARADMEAARVEPTLPPRKTSLEFNLSCTPIARGMCVRGHDAKALSLGLCGRCWGWR